jgi:hypothetical protein
MRCLPRTGFEDWANTTMEKNLRNVEPARKRSLLVLEVRIL